jgi:hypothetical protein
MKGQTSGGGGEFFLGEACNRVIIKLVMEKSSIRK